MSIQDFNETPDDLHAIESQLRTLRPEAPRLLILQPRPRARAAYASMPVITLLVGILIGGWSVESLRPVSQVETADGRRQTAAELLPLPEPEPIVVQSIAVSGIPEPDLDTMLEEYTRRAKLFAHVERVAVMPSSSNGSISDPTSVFRLRETMNL